MTQNTNKVKSMKSPRTFFNRYPNDGLREPVRSYENRFAQLITSRFSGFVK